MDHDTLGSIGVVVHASAQPLLDFLREIGVEIGSIKLADVARLMGRSDKIAEDIRCICVAFPSAHAAMGLSLAVIERLTPEQLDDIRPLAALKVSDERYLTAFLGAVGVARFEA